MQSCVCVCAQVADVSVELAQQPGAHQLGVLMSKVSAHRPVYGLQLDMFLECVSEYGQAYASAFVNFYWVSKAWCGKHIHTQTHSHASYGTASSQPRMYHFRSADVC